jgi:hypothetical protein
MVAKNDSATALSQHWPRRPTGSRTPSWSARRAYWLLVYWANSTGRRNTPMTEVGMGRPQGWTTKVTGRPAMRLEAKHDSEMECRFMSIGWGVLPCV